MKKIFTIILAFIVSAGTVFAETVASGTCGADGDNLTWTLDDKGVLTISGSGAMAGWKKLVDIPWYSWRSSTITSVVISDGVTSIGESAFDGCSGLTSVTIPNSVTSIGNWAFSDCSSLTSVTIGNSVTSIGDYAFWKCSSLTSIEIPNSVTSIGKQAFRNCSGLTSVTIPNSVASIGEQAFRNCSNLTSIEIPNSVTSIGSNAFDGCGLTSVTIPNSVTSIEDWTFQYCSGLTSVTIPNSVTSIGYSAFFHCENLTSVTIGNSVTSIGDYAFGGCSALTSVTIPNSVTSLGKYAFRNCSGLTSFTCEATTPPDCGISCFSGMNMDIPVYVPDGSVEAYSKASGWNEFTNIQTECFLGSGTCGAKGDNLTWELNCDGVLTISGTGAMIYSIKTTDVPWYPYRSAIQSVVVEEGVTSIGTLAFNGYSNITSITLPASLTLIDSYSLYGCSGLTSLTIPTNVTTIEESAFNGCTGLKSITCEAVNPPALGEDCFKNVDKTIPLSVPEESIEAYSKAYGWNEFSNIQCLLGSGTCGAEGNNLTWNLTCDGVLTISGTGAMAEYTSDYPGWYSFVSQIKEVTLLNGVTTIGAYAFWKCTSLTSVTIPSSVESINYRAFSGCSALTSINVAADNPNYSSDGGVLFAKDENILILIQYPVGNPRTEYTIPNGVLVIYSYAFSGCTTLTSIVLPSSIQHLAGSAFYDCTGLTSITCKAIAPPSCEDECFKGVDKGIPVYVPEGTVAKYQAATGWNEFTNIQGTLPCDPISGTCGAEGDNLKWELTCDGVLTISGTGAMKDWEDFDDIPWYSHSYSVQSVIINEGVTSLGNLAFAGCRMTSVEIPNSVTRIGKQAFSFCSALTSVTIPNSVTSIGYWAFSDCSALTSIDIPNSVTSIGNGAFDGCGLTSATIGSGVTSLGDWVFEKCSSLTTITVAADNTTYSSADGVLFNKDKTILIQYPVGNPRKEYTIPDGVIGFIGTAFRDCMTLTTVVIPTSVTGISFSAFSGCTGLSSVTIPNSVEVIGYEAFAYCTGLTSITCEAITPPVCGEDCFLNVDKSIPVYVPIQSVEAYKSTDVWKDFENIQSAEKYPIVGTCGKEGDNLTWTLEEGGLLTISGTGEMADYELEHPSWQPYISSINTVKIEDGATSIGDFAFYNCSSLTSVTIGNNVTSIGDGAFYDCTGLTSITCEAITPPTCGEDCFLNVDKSIPVYVPLQSVDAYWNAKEWEDFNNFETFVDYPVNGICGKDGEGNLADNLTWTLEEGGLLTISGTGDMADDIEESLSWKLFREYIKSIVIEDGVTGIGNSAFEYCYKIEEVTIPNSVISIGNNAFYRCDGEDFNVIEIPNSVKTIGDNAFYMCDCLHKIIIGSGVTDIGEYAFQNCKEVNEITCKAVTPPACGTKCFDFVPKTIPVYVPIQSLEAYQKAPQWKYFFGFYQPMPIHTCAEVNTAYDGTPVQIENAKVLFVFGLYAYLQDETGTTLIYLSHEDDNIQPSVQIFYIEGEVDIYNGLPEIRPSNQNSWILGASEEIIPIVHSLEEAPTAGMVNQLVFIPKAAVEAGEFTTGSQANLDIQLPNGGAAILRNQFRLEQTFAENKVYDVLAAVAVFKTTVQLYFIQVLGAYDLYHVRFLSDDGATVLDDQIVPAGTVPVFGGEIPVKEDQGCYTYPFAGWDKTIYPASQDIDYKAVYEEEVKDYTVTFLSDDGETILGEFTVACGTDLSDPEIIAEIESYLDLTKKSTAQYNYTFAGWTPALDVVTGDATYTAVYEEELRYYTITWIDWDGSFIDEETYPYGDMPSHFGPTRSSTPQYDYTFSGWSPAIAPVSGDATYTAVYKETLCSYTVTWKTDDGSVIAQENYNYGDMPNHAAPVKESTAQFHYTFAGWSPNVVKVTGPAIYTAVFDAELRSYTVTWVNWDGTVLDKETYNYGSTPYYVYDDPVRPATAENTFTFTGWSPEISEVTGDVTYKAQFSATGQTYTITWKMDDSSVIAKETYAYGDMPNHAAPVKESTAQYNYTFTGWTPEISKVTGDATYTAVFKAEVRSYTVTWLNWDGAELAKETYAYGAQPEYKGNAPARKATAQFSYTFTGWNPAVAKVSGDATYTAVFKETKNSYTITWKMDDGSVIAKETYAYGDMPSHAAPVKEATAQYTYTFTGWTPVIAPVSGDATYTASFKAEVRSYTVTWKNWDGKQLAKETYTYGETPAFTGAVPVHPATEQFSYTFTGWSPAIVSVTGDATYTAVFKETKNSYTVTWKMDDGTLIAQQSYNYGETPSHTAPVKESTAQYNYTFSGWTPEIVAVTGDATYTASFKAEVRSYTVSWLNWDGTELAKESYTYGVTPSFKGSTPSRPATAQNTFTFTGWSPVIAPVSGDVTYKAQFSATGQTYTVTWKMDDGSVIDKETYAYGDMPNHTAPVKDATLQYTYTFTGWTPVISEVTGDATYTAVFEAELHSYTITWKMDDGTVIAQDQYTFGETPSHTAPVKDATAQYSYTFTGWSPAIAAVTGDATYTATFKETKNSYTITWKMDDGSVIAKETYAYGDMPSHAVPVKEATAQYTYTFRGWTPALTSVTGDATYTAVFSATERSYTVTWLNWDGSELAKQSYAYGLTPSYNGAVPVRPATEQFSYTFTGWTPAVVPVSGDATYTAVFKETKNSYTVTWKMDDGSVIAQENYNYGDMPNHTAPVKEQTAQYTYTFSDWNPEIKAVSGDAAYTAVFKAVERSYTVIWVNWDGSELAKETYAYGAKPEYKGTTPARPATAENTFTFTGWSPAITAVTGDVTYKAQFSSTGQTYTVTWKMDDGTELGKETYVYGDMPSHAAPVKEETAQHTYTFAGWIPEITEVTEDATYTAVFKAEERSYTVTWVNWDGAELVKETYLYGATPEYKGSTPVKPATEQNVYTFTGWSPAVGLVTGDVTYKAQFSSAGVTYTVTFLGKDGNVLDKQEVFVGGAAVAPEAPEVEGFTFTGWDKKFDVVTEDMTVKALYEEVIDLTPTNLAVVLNEKDGDVQLVFSWDKVDGVPSYEVKLIADGEELGAMNTFGQNKVTLLLSQVLAMYSIPVGTYTMDWEVRSTDIMGKAVSDWAQGPQFEVTVKGEATGAEEVPSGKVQGTKVFIDGLIYILRDGKTFTITGQKVN